MKHVYLLPGKLLIPGDGEEVSTNLGSCVSVVLSDPIAGLAGMSHYVLPFPNEKQNPTPRFGSIAIPELIHRLELAGAKLARLQAHIYGGGNIFRGLTVTKDIGEQNIAVAFHIPTRKGIPVVHQEVGGIQARRVTLSTNPFKIKAAASTPENAADLDISGFGARSAPTEITVAIVDDNENIRDLFQKIFKQNGLKVVGTAGNAHEARALIVEKKPMVVTLDIEMPGMTGVQFLDKLMKHFPTPVVMVSQLDAYGEEAMQAMQFGAVEFVQKPLNFDTGSLRAMAQSLVDKVRAAAFHVVSPRRNVITAISPIETKPQRDCKLIAIGGNIGSPEFLEKLVQGADKNTPPLVIANTTIGYFLSNYLRRVEQKSAIKLHIASNGQKLLRGNAYFIPKPFNGNLIREQGELQLNLCQAGDTAKHVPSINVLFTSLATAVGADGTAVLLSSFGSDGISGLEAVSSSGGRIFLQHPNEIRSSQTIQHAVELGLFDTLLPVADMAAYLATPKEADAA